MSHEPSPESTKKGFFGDESNVFALCLGLGMTFVFGPALGFYMGTVFISPHVVDLQVHDIVQGGLPGAGIGFLVGLAGLIYILTVYPSRTQKDTDDWNEEFSHTHFSGPKGH